MSIPHRRNRREGTAEQTSNVLNDPGDITCTPHTDEHLYTDEEYEEWLSGHFNLTPSGEFWLFRGDPISDLQNSLDTFSHSLDILNSVREKFEFHHICIIPLNPVIIVLDTTPSPVALTSLLDLADTRQFRPWAAGNGKKLREYHRLLVLEFS
jgi:hypothetical protein